MKRSIKTMIAAVAALALSAVMLAGCSGGSDNSQASTDTNAETFTLTVGFDQGYPPYGYVDDNGEYVGLDLDLAKEVCERNGWEYKCEPIDWEAKDALLNQGTVNCIWNGFTYEGREDQYTWSEPYMLNGQVVCTRADSDINSEADLAGKNVMTQVESSALEVLESEEFADLTASFGQLQTIDTYNNAFMQLESGMVDAVVCDLSMAKYQMAAKEGTFKQIADLSSEHYAVGFKLGDEELASQVTATLREMAADGTAKEICEKYDVDFENSWVLE